MSEENKGAPDGRAVVNGAASVSAVPASIPSAGACRIMREALEEIAVFGRNEPGRGYTCATIAINALEKLNDQDT